MRKLVLLSLFFLLGVGAIAKEQHTTGPACVQAAEPATCTKANDLQGVIDKLEKRVAALEATSGGSGNSLEARVSKLEKIITGTGAEGSGLESRVGKLEITVRQI